MKRLLQEYKDKDLDFGLDAQGLSELVGGDKEWASEIIDAFGSTNGMYVRFTCVEGGCYELFSLNGWMICAISLSLSGTISKSERTGIHLWRRYGLSSLCTGKSRM